MESLKDLKSQWDRVGAILLVIGGAVVLILGYFGVSNQGLAAEQMPYIVSGGLGGIFLMGVGAALWLSADLRDEWKKLDRLESVLENGLEHLGLARGIDGHPTLMPLEFEISRNGMTEERLDVSPEDSGGRRISSSASSAPASQYRADTGDAESPGNPISTSWASSERVR